MFCECGCGQKTWVPKYNDARWRYVAGKPVRFVHGHSNKRSPETRFWEKVNKLGKHECWNWAAMKRSGYGMMRVGGKMTGAHRFSYELAYGEVPKELDVLHRCDNPSCVNPNHLFLGTHRENMLDCVRKGRRPYHKGESHHNSKLTKTKVLKIRALASTIPFVAIANRFGISPPQVRNIVLRHQWTHV